MFELLGATAIAEIVPVPLVKSGEMAVHEVALSVVW